MVDPLFADAYLAGCYDIWHPRSTRDDYDFYLPYVMASDAVLDAGCGTGTLLGDARAAGHRGRLCGLDPGAGMLGLARKIPDVEWVQGELRHAPWRAEFDLVVMTGHAFQALVGDDEIQESLGAVRRALRPGGRFAFETRNPAARAWTQWRPEHAVTLEGPHDRPVRIATQVVAPFDGRTVSFTHTFDGEHPSLPQVSRSTLRFVDPATLAGLLEQAGLRIDAQFGAFDGSPLTAASPEIITIAGRAT